MSDDPKLEELDKLISTGKQKGYVTYEEVNDALPARPDLARTSSTTSC